MGLFYNASEPTRGGINYKMMNMITSVSVASMFSSTGGWHCRVLPQYDIPKQEMFNTNCDYRLSRVLYKCNSNCVLFTQFIYLLIYIFIL